MQAIVHFTVGLSFGLAVLVFTDFRPRTEFVILIASGYWAVVPDGWRVARGFGLEGVSRIWRALHRSVLADVFWFHHFLDNHEGNVFVEMGLGFTLLLVASGFYLFFNDWGGP